MKIDHLDLSIIKHLQDDARLSFRELGQKLKVPHTTVFTRAERLVNRGIIKRFSAILHPHEIKLQTGYIIIDAPPEKSKEIAKHIAGFNEANKVSRTFDGKIIAEVIVPNSHHGLEEFLSKAQVHPVKAYAVHEVIKYENKIHDSTLQEVYKSNPK